MIRHFQIKPERRVKTIISR